MYKDGNSISIDLINETVTEELNGVSVQVPLNSSYDIDKFCDAIEDQLVYFENVYFINGVKDERFSYFNDFKIKKYEHFLVNNLGVTRDIDIVLGKVRYPLNKSHFKVRNSFLGVLVPISLKFEIGDLEVTPNREEILYNQKNISTIQDRLDKSFDYLEEMFTTQNTKDYDVLSEYIEVISKPTSVVLMEGDTEFNEVTFNMKFSSFDKDNQITFKGVNYNPKTFLSHYNSIMKIPFFFKSHYIQKNKFYSDGSAISASNIKDDFGKFYFCHVVELNNMSKTYIREKFPNFSKFIHFKTNKSFLKRSLKMIRKSIKDNVGYNYDYRISKIVFLNILENISRMQKFDNSKVPQQYIADKKAQAKLLRSGGVDWKENFNVYVLRQSDRGYGNVTSDAKTLSFETYADTFKGLLNIYDVKDSTKLRTLFTMLERKGLNFLEVAPTKAKYLAQANNYISMQEFMDPNKSRVMRQIATTALIRRELPHLNELYLLVSSIRKISSNLANVIEVLYDYVEKHSFAISKRLSKQEIALYDEIFNLCEENNAFNLSIKDLLDKNKNTLHKAKVFILFAERKTSYGSGIHIPNERINLVVDYLLARKYIRPDLAAAKKLKKETILNLELDENN